MTTFILSCAGLVILSSIFYLFPRARPGSSEEDLDRANRQWLRRRHAELTAEGNDALLEDAGLRLLEDEQQHPSNQKIMAQFFPLWILLPLVAVFSGALYYFLGAAPDVLISRQMDNVDEHTSPQQMQRLVQSIEERVAQRPDNLHYTALLGRYYMEHENYARAAQAYGDLAQAAPGDPQALAYAAQAEYLSAGRSLNDRARLRAEQALAVDPHQRTALGLLGMASFEQQQYRAAIDYWQRLLVMEPPDSEGHRMIAQVIESARQHLEEVEPGASVPDATASVQEKVATSGAGVTVRVLVPDNADIAPSDTVFILARNADSNSRMPIAVERLTGAQLPVTVRLDDSNSMAGQKLSSTPAVIIAVQVSSDGRPGEAGASWLGQIGPVVPGVDNEPLDILLQPNN